MNWKPTNDFRWLRKYPDFSVFGGSHGKSLQQKWEGFDLGNTFPIAVEWRDIPTVTEESKC